MCLVAQAMSPTTGVGNLFLSSSVASCAIFLLNPNENGRQEAKELELKY